MTPPTYSIYWDLPLLIVVVSLVYSATRYEDWRAIVLEAVRWGLRMTTFLGGIGLALYLVGWWLDSGASWWVLAAVAAAAAVVVGSTFILLSKRRTAVQLPPA
jgi:hypothetical protein